MDRTTGDAVSRAFVTTIAGEGVPKTTEEKIILKSGENISILTCDVEESSKGSGGETNDNSMGEQNVENKEECRQEVCEGESEPYGGCEGSHCERRHSSISQPSALEWSISFEQFLANVANEEKLVAFFERPVNVAQEVQKLRKRHAVSTSSSGSVTSTP